MKGVGMYHVTVHDHMMIAHRFRGEVFGPAQRLHGATYAVAVTFLRPALDGDGLVVDIGRALQVLRDILAEFDLSDLDAHPDLAGHNTTTEFMARVVFDRMRAAIARGALGPGGKGLARLRVVLSESPVAEGGYEAAL